jgi:hypothetical protein
VPYEEGSLAEHRVAVDVAEVLEEDPADEGDVQAREQGQVARTDGAAAGDDTDQVGDGDGSRVQRPCRSGGSPGCAASA